jgi:hypothetical protein
MQADLLPTGTIIHEVGIPKPTTLRNTVLVEEDA